MTNEEMFKQEISDVCKKWDDILQSKNEKDFNSLDDYDKWLRGCFRNKQIEIDHIYYFYGRSEYLSENEMLEIIAKLNALRHVVCKPVNKY